jgi:hypothetical protein
MKLSALVVGLVALSFGASAQSLPPPNGWLPLRAGGGGYVSGLGIPPGTGTRLARTDAGGAYVWGCFPQVCGWQQLLTTNIMPAADIGFNSHGNDVNELVGCNTNAACAYMYLGGYVFYSANINVPNQSAITFCRDAGNLAQQTSDVSNLYATRGQGPTLAVDPVNADHVILGTSISATPLSTQGLWETFNGTSCNPTWTQIPTASVPLSSTMGYRIAFDPTVSATCHTGTGTCAKNAYIWTHGGGVYATANAGSAWALTTGGPAYVSRMIVSYASVGGGTLWITDTNGNGYVWRYAAGTWLKMTVPTACCDAVAVNPNNGNEVVALGSLSHIWVSVNAAAATPTWTSYTSSFASGDTPWQTQTQVTHEAGSADVYFDPLTGSQIIATGGQAIWTTPLPTTGSTFTWAPEVNGIVELVFTGRLAVTAPGIVTAGVQDEGSCTLSVPYNLTNNATTCGLLSQMQPLSYAAGLSIAPGTNTMFAKVSQDFAGGFDMSGTSTDGFVTTYQPFNTWNALVSPSGFENNGAGLIRAMVPSTAGLTTWSAGSGTIVCAISTSPSWVSVLPQRCFTVTVVDGMTLDLQGTTWTSTGIGTNNILLYVSATPFNSWAGLGTINNVVSDTGNLVKVTTTGNGVLGADGYPVCISGVSMLGSSVVNGCWIAEKQSGTSFDLTGSNFVTGDGYVTGGVTNTWNSPGGGIAAASTTNWTMFGSDRNFPFCTANGGASYSQVNSPGTGWYALTTVTGGPYPGGSTSFTVANGAVVTLDAMYVPLASGRTFYTTQYTVAGNTVTLTGSPVPPGDSIATGAGVSNSTGWPWAAYFYTRMIDVDPVTPNTFYGVNVSFGLLKWTDCNPPVLVTNTGPNGGFLVETYSATLRAIQGQAGHLFYTPGPQGTNQAPSSTGLWRTCNGVNSTAGSVTWAKVPGFFSPHTVGYGAAAPGKSYPALIVAGWYAANGIEADSVFGIWRSTDDGSAGSTTTCTNGTWQNLSPASPFIGGWNTNPVLDTIGDPYVYGPVYVATDSGMWYINAQ